MVLYQAKDETKYNECLKFYCFESERYQVWFKGLNTLIQFES